MELLKNMVGDLAIIALIASFMEILVPSGPSRNVVRLVLGLYFLAVMLTPVLSLMGNDDLASLDFSKIEMIDETWGDEWEEQENDTDIYDVAASSIASEIDGRLGAIYEEENYKIDSSVTMNKTEIQNVTVEISGVSSGKERVVFDEIKRFLNSEYGISSKHIDIAFKEAEYESE